MKPKKIRLFDLLGTIPPEVYLDVVDSKYPDNFLMVAPALDVRQSLPKKYLKSEVINSKPIGNLLQITIALNGGNRNNET